MTTLSEDHASSLLPPRRLGALLAHARSSVGLSYDQVAGMCANRFGIDDLYRVENGTRLIDDDDVRILAALYGLSTSQIIPQRGQLCIDQHEGLIAAGDTTGRFTPGGDDREIMLRYLSLVYVLRAMKPGRFFVPRIADLVVLGRVMDASPAAVRRDLEWLMRSGRREIIATGNNMARRVVMPTIGILVALTSVGGLLFLHPAAASEPPQIGSATVIERATDPVSGVHLNWASRRNDPRLVMIG